MLSKKMMETIMGFILTLGTLVSAILVLLGGIMFLSQHGNANVKTELLFSSPVHINTQFIKETITNFSPLGIIELGLLFLVATQILRVALLVLYYFETRDFYFFGICSFVLVIILSTFVYNFIGI